MFNNNSQILLFWTLFFAVILLVLLAINLYNWFKFRKWNKALIDHGAIIPCDAEDLTKKSEFIPFILLNMMNKEDNLGTFLEQLDENHGMEASVIVVALMVDQFKDMMSPLALKMSEAVLNVVGKNFNKEDLQKWDLNIPGLHMVNFLAEEYARDVLYLPAKLAKWSMNPMQKQLIREEKATAKMEAELKRNHCMS